MSTESMAIIGGGMLGLRLAQRFRRAGHQVTLFEAAPALGGLAGTWDLNGIQWDKHYHVILLSDLHVRELIRDIGLEDQFRWVETKTGFYTNGQLYSMSNSLEFLKFPPLGLIDKLRLGATIFRASRIRDWKNLEQISVEAWLRKWSGNRTFEKIWLPLLRSKLGESYRIASAAFIWAIIARMYAARRSGLKKEMFGYIRGGYRTILDAWIRQLQADGVDLQTGQRIQSIDANEAGGVDVTTADRRQRFDRVVVTAAAPLAAQLCPGLNAQEQQRLQGITYQGIVCASVLLKQPLDRFYVTNITEAWVPFTAVIEMTALVDRAEFGGNSLVYLPKYVAPDDPHFNLSDDEIRERFLSALEKIYPHFKRDQVLAFQVSRVRQVFAVSTIGYSQAVPPMVTSIPGLYLANSAHIVNGTLNVNETLALADQAFATIRGDVPRPVPVTVS